MKLHKIYIYPIKSLSGVELSSVKILETGLNLDRKWMLVDENGNFLTQRKHSNMATIGIRLIENGIIAFKKSDSSTSIFIPFEIEQKNQIKAQIWNDEVSSWIMPIEINQWFSDILGLTCQLVIMDQQRPRSRKLSVSPYQTELSYTDGYPIQVLSLESVDYISKQINQEIDIRQFRANLILKGGTPYSEDDLQQFNLGSCQLNMIKKTKRCVVTTINQDTGTKSKEPLKYLSEYRKDDKSVVFGMYAGVIQPGEVRLGDLISKVM